MTDCPSQRRKATLTRNYSRKFWVLRNMSSVVLHARNPCGSLRCMFEERTARCPHNSSFTGVQVPPRLPPMRDGQQKATIRRYMRRTVKEVRTHDISISKLFELRPDFHAHTIVALSVFPHDLDRLDHRSAYRWDGGRHH